MILEPILNIILYCYLLSLFIPRMFRIITFILLIVQNSLMQNEKSYWNIFISHSLWLRLIFGTSGINECYFYLFLGILSYLLRYIFLWFFTKYNIDSEVLDLLYLQIPLILKDIVILFFLFSVIKITEVKINFLSFKSRGSTRLKKLFFC